MQSLTLLSAQKIYVIIIINKLAEKLERIRSFSAYSSAINIFYEQSEAPPSVVDMWLLEASSASWPRQLGQQKM